jgi:hypothetical protein
MNLAEELQEEALDEAPSEGAECEDTNLPYKLAQTKPQTRVTNARMCRQPHVTNYKLQTLLLYTLFMSGLQTFARRRT